MKLWRNALIGAVVVAVVVGGLFFLAAKRDEQQQQGYILQREMRQTVRQYQIAAQAGLPIPRPAPSAAKGDVGKIGNAMFAIVYNLASQGQTYQTLVRTRCGPAMAPAALARPGGLDAAHKAVAECRAAGRRYRDLVTRTLADLPAQMDRLDIDAGLRREVMAGMTSTLGVGQSEVGAMFTAELSVYDRLDETLDWLATVKGRWRPQNGMMVFDRAADADEYNRRMDAVQRSAQEIERIKAGQAARFNAPY